MKNTFIKPLSFFLILIFASISIFSPMTVYASDYDLPLSDLGKFKSYEYYTSITCQGTQNRAIAWGEKYKGTKYNTKTDKKTGIRVVDDVYYCVALGSYFKTGKYKGCSIGSKFTVELSSGKKFKVIWCDQKADKDTDEKYHIYHKIDKSVIEFVVDSLCVPSEVMSAGSYNALSQFSGTIKSITPEGNNNSNILNNGDGSSNDNDSISSTEIGNRVITISSGYNVSSKLLQISVFSDIDSLNFKANSSVNTSDELSDAKKKLQDEIDAQEEAENEVVEAGDGITTGTLAKPLDTMNYSLSALRYSGGTWHGGNDLSCATGTPVYAMDGGEVVASTDLILNGHYYSYGKYIKIKCNTSEGVYYMYYAHLSNRLVNVGDKITQGQLIAKSGNTGNSTGPHLHIEIRTNKDSHTEVINPSNCMGKSYVNAQIYKS